MPDVPWESILQRDNARHNPAMTNTSQYITLSDNGDTSVNSDDDRDNYDLANIHSQIKGKILRQG